MHEPGFLLHWDKNCQKERVDSDENTENTWAIRHRNWQTNVEHENNVISGTSKYNNPQNRIFFNGEDNIHSLLTISIC